MTSPFLDLVVTRDPAKLKAMGVTNPKKVYMKSAHLVYDTDQKDSAGHVPTHRLTDSTTDRGLNESWEQYEQRVLAEKIPKEPPVLNDLKTLKPDVQTAIASLLKDAKASNVHLSPVETTRSLQRQKWLFQQGRANKNDVVTWTLTSDHMNSRAVDFAGNKAAAKWLQANAPKYGFATLGDMDPLHISLPAKATK